MPVVGEVSVEVRADDAQFRQAMSRVEQETRTQRTVTVGARTRGAGDSPGSPEGPATEGGEERRARRAEQSEGKRHGETTKLLRNIALAGAAAVSIPFIAPITSGIGTAIAAPFLPLIADAAKAVGDIGHNAGQFIQQVNTGVKFAARTAGGEHFEATPGSSLARARDDYRRYKELTGGEFNPVRDFTVGVGLGVAEVGRDFWNYWFGRRKQPARDPDGTYYNANQSRASSGYGGSN